MKSALVVLLGASLVAATPVRATAPADPIDFEISRDGQVVWRGALVPRRIPSADYLGAEQRVEPPCNGAAARSSFDLSIQVPLETPEIPMGDEYLYSFNWSRPFDPDPRRLEACGESSSGSRSSGRSGAFHIGRTGRVSFALPDDLTITFYR